MRRVGVGDLMVFSLINGCLPGYRWNSEFPSPGAEETAERTLRSPVPPRQPPFRGLTGSISA